jgi:Family of unknown function (DUF5706)
MENKEKIENLKFIIGRYDNYIESTHTKSNVYLSLNTAVLAGVITLISTLKISELTNYLAYILIAIAIITVISIIIILGAIKPSLLSNKMSIIFFGDVAESSNDNYLDKVKKMNDKDFTIDISNQAHYLAKIVSSKFKIIKWVGNLIKIEFILLLIWLIIYINK